MIDIHAHLLPGIDDGPINWEDSITMLKQGVEDGITGVVCTSHVLNKLDSVFENQLVEKFQELKRRVQQENISVDLWLGAEIHIQSEYTLESPLATINNNGKYMLIELPLSEIPDNAAESIFQLCLDGIIPILAHPERNGTISQEPIWAYEFAQRGLLLQINAGSVTGYFGKRTKRLVYQFLDHGYVHFVASDCHNPKARTMILSHAYKIIEKKWGKETARRLFIENPKKSITGQPIQTQEYEPLGQTTSLLRTLFRF